jgi:hypothetical protein
MRTATALVVGAIASVVAVMAGVWWAPFVVGIAIGIAEPRTRIAVPVGATSGLLGWTLPLAADQLLYGLGSTASSLAAIMGFGHQSVIPITLTCLVGLLLGLSGAWLGCAGRSLVRPQRDPLNPS